MLRRYGAKLFRALYRSNIREPHTRQFLFRTFFARPVKTEVPALQDVMFNIVRMAIVVNHRKREYRFRCIQIINSNSGK